MTAPAADWSAVGTAVRNRLAELGMLATDLSRKTRIAESTVRHLGKGPSRKWVLRLVARS